MRRPTRREWKDASRTAFIVAATTGVAAFVFQFLPSVAPPATPSRGSLRTNVLRDLSWVAVAAVSMMVPRLGDAGPKCVERLVGNVLGGALGMAAVLSHDAFAATAIAALTGLLGDLVGPVTGWGAVGSISTTTYIVVAMPAFSTFGSPRSWAADSISARQAAERVLTVTVAVVLVYLISILWFPHAASEEAFDHAAGTVRAVREMGVSAFAPAAVLEEEEEGAQSSSGEEEENQAPRPRAAAKAVHPPPPSPPLSKAAAARAAVNGAYLARIQTLALRPVVDQAARAAHLAELEGRLGAAVAARSKLSAALGTARKEVVAGRLPFLRWRDSLTRWCVSAADVDGPDTGVKRRARKAEEKEAAVEAAGAALPPPTTTTTPLLSSTPSTVAWRPVYVPTFGTGASAWLRRLAPRHFGRRALPAPQLEDVGRAAGSVARALWMVGDAACGGGFGSGAAAGPGPASPPAAAALVAHLSSLVESCLTEALSGLAAARSTFLAGASTPPPDGRCLGLADKASRAQAAEAVLASTRTRWPTLKKLQEAQVALVECGDEGGKPNGRLEDGILRAGGFLTTPRAGDKEADSAAVAAARVRWLTLLFGVSEARRGLEELAAAVEALRDACECAALAKRGGVALLEESKKG